MKEAYINTSTIEQEMIDYLNQRITALEKSHERYQEREIAARTDEERVAYNSSAAGIWDSLTEIKKVLEMYNKIHSI